MKLNRNFKIRMELRQGKSKTNTRSVSENHNDFLNNKKSENEMCYEKSFDNFSLCYCLTNASPG